MSEELNQTAVILFVRMEHTNGYFHFCCVGTLEGNLKHEKIQECAWSERHFLKDSLTTRGHHNTYLYLERANHFRDNSSDTLRMRKTWLQVRTR